MQIFYRRLLSGGPFEAYDSVYIQLGRRQPYRNCRISCWFVSEVAFRSGYMLLLYAVGGVTIKLHPRQQCIPLVLPYQRNSLSAEFNSETSLAPFMLRPLHEPTIIFLRFSFFFFYLLFSLGLTLSIIRTVNEELYIFLMNK